MFYKNLYSKQFIKLKIKIFHFFCTGITIILFLLFFWHLTMDLLDLFALFLWIFYWFRLFNKQFRAIFVYFINKSFFFYIIYNFKFKFILNKIFFITIWYSFCLFPTYITIEILAFSNWKIIFFIFNHNHFQFSFTCTISNNILSKIYFLIFFTLKSNNPIAMRCKFFFSVLV